jgi:hypothetical protein
MKQNIYVKTESNLFSKPVMVAFLIVAIGFASINYALTSNLIITELASQLIYTLSFLIATFSLYQITKVKESNYIYLTDDEIWFKDKNQNETVCLKFDVVDHFETRFSEIIFCTKEEQKVVMQLNEIKDEKKRWEIKEFLKEHIKQIRDSKANLLASA